MLVAAEDVVVVVVGSAVGVGGEDARDSLPSSSLLLWQPSSSASSSHESATALAALDFDFCVEDEERLSEVRSGGAGWEGLVDRFGIIASVEGFGDIY